MSQPRKETGSGVPDIKSAIACTYVEPRGSIRAVVGKVAGREVLGAVGGALAGAATQPGDRSPVQAGGIAFLAVFAEEIVVFRGKRGALKPKPTAEVIASVPRSAVASAQLDRKGMSAALTVTFTDEETWEFDLPRVHVKAAKDVVQALR